MKDKADFTVNKLLSRLEPAQLVNIIDPELKPEDRTLFSNKAAKFRDHADELGERVVKIIGSSVSAAGRVYILVYVY